MKKNVPDETMSEINTNIVKEILQTASDDWFSLAEVACRVVDICNLEWVEGRNDVKEKTLDVLLYVLEKGYIYAGYFSGTDYMDGLLAAHDPLVYPLITIKNSCKNHLVFWRLSPDETVAKIRSEWIDSFGTFDLSDICWFEITEEGEKELARMLAEDGAQ